MALGASRGNVQVLILRQGLNTIMIGVAAGVTVTLALLKVLRGLTPGLSSYDFATLAIAIGLVSATAVSACWLPARRAAKVDPMVALRYE